MDDLRCASCGEGDDLSGEAVGDLIEVTCGACGASWTRDPRPACPTCGSTDLIAAARAVVERSRGSQLSIVSTDEVHLCPVCQPDLVRSYLDGRTPLMPDHLPTRGPQDE